MSQRPETRDPRPEVRGTAVLRFEDLVAWQKARNLAREVYVATREGGFLRDVDLARQIRRAAVSVMATIAEGYERRSVADYLRFLIIAKASCAEVISHLYVALDVGYIDPDRFGHLTSLARETARVTAGLYAATARRTARVSGLGSRVSAP